MPNWVFNTIGGYTEEMYEKYKNDEEELDIDFNKIIPMPEELDIPDMHPTHEYAIATYEYDKYKSETKNPNYWAAPNSIRDSMDGYYNRNIADFGKMAVSNPDKPLNDIINNDYYRKKLDNFTNIYGDLNKSNTDVGIERLDKYTDYMESEYQNTIDRNKKDSMMSDSTKKLLEAHPTLLDLGKHYVDCKEKYGFDNWYDWRIANWGVKWNANETSYEDDNIHFDTAWSIPYPIISKIAEEFPNAELDGYSEEETGWFEEYKSKNGLLGITQTGEQVYDDETDEYHEELDEMPEEIEYKAYEQIRDEHIQDWTRVTQEWSRETRRKTLIF